MQICKASSIEKAITTLNAPDDTERRSQIQSRMSTLDLGQEYARYEERAAYKSRIKDALAGTDYEGRTSEIAQYLTDHKSASRRELYIGSLHSFGRADGVEIYRILKDVV